MNKLLILTWMSGETKFEKEANVFFNSLEHSGFCSGISHKKVLFTTDLSSHFRNKIESLNWDVIDVVPEYEIKDYHSILRERWYNYWSYLKSNGWNYSNVMITDSRDVFFQKPLDSKYFNYKSLWLVSEGISHQESHWNELDQLAFQHGLRYRKDYRKWPVLNGGFQIGYQDNMLELCKTMWLTSTLTAGPNTDQAILNYVYNNLLRNEIYIADPASSNLCITGESIARNALGFSYEFTDGKLRNKDSNFTYSVFHQWDRTPFKEEILSFYS